MKFKKQNSRGVCINIYEYIYLLTCNYVSTL